MKRLLPGTTVRVLEGDSLSRAWRSALENAEFVDAAAITTATGGAATLPANPVGFIRIKRNGGFIRIPYYND